MNGAGCVPDLVVRKRPHFLIDYLVCQWEKEGRSVERVERVDQKVEWHSLHSSLKTKDFSNELDSPTTVAF